MGAWGVCGDAQRLGGSWEKVNLFGNRLRADKGSADAMGLDKDVGLGAIA